MGKEMRGNSVITANEYYRSRFGCKVYKLSLDGGFTCPNRDGTLGRSGCLFCSHAGGGDFAERGNSVPDQLERAKARVSAKIHDGKYIAYFQAFTGTYGPIEKLERLYRQALAPDYIVGLAIGTRPDCLPPEVVDLLAQLNREKPVTIELGLQTANDETARKIRRGYPLSVYQDAVKRLNGAGIEVVTHIIIGLPGEDGAQAVATTKAAVEAGTNGIKFHLLHVLKGTDLEQEYLAGRYQPLSLEEYGEILRECVACLPPDLVVHRITGDGAKKDLVAPLWSGDKKRVMNYLNNLLRPYRNSL